MNDVAVGALTVSKRFGATTALDGVDFEVLAGEIHALVGENGAGKSTLLKCLTGALELNAGQVIRSRGLRIGSVPQDVPAGLAERTSTLTGLAACARQGPAI